MIDGWSYLMLVESCCDAARLVWIALLTGFESGDKNSLFFICSMAVSP